MTDDPDQATDQQLVVAYVLRELDERARWQFEQRLATEPELAAQVAAFETLDLVGATLAATRSMPASRPHHILRASAALTLLAAAAALLVVWLWPATDVISCDVRAVASPAFGDVGSYAASLGLAEEYQHPIGEQRGGTSPTKTVSVADFLAVAAAREQERSEAALTAASSSAKGAFFTLRFRVDRECSAVVLQLDSAGGLHRRYPSRSDLPLFGEAANRFPAGATHVLPRPIALSNVIGTVSLHAGFDVPSDLPLRRTWLVLAVRRAPVGADLLDEVDARLAREQPTLGDLQAMTPGEQEVAVDRRLAATLAWLRTRGFTTRRVVVEGA